MKRSFLFLDRWGGYIPMFLLLFLVIYYPPIIIRGNSMNPNIHSGAVLGVRIDQQHLQGSIEGNVYWFKTQEDSIHRGRNVVHRAVEDRDGCVVMKGDNNPLDDGCIPYEDIEVKIYEDTNVNFLR